MRPLAKSLSRFGASDLDQSVRGNALCGTPSRAGGEIARQCFTDATLGFQPVSQDAGQPDRARIASDEAPVGGGGTFKPGQSEECVTMTGAGEVVAATLDPASASDGHLHGERS